MEMAEMVCRVRDIEPIQPLLSVIRFAMLPWELLLTL